MEEVGRWLNPQTNKHLQKMFQEPLEETFSYPKVFWGEEKKKTPWSWTLEIGCPHCPTGHSKAFLGVVVGWAIVSSQCEPFLTWITQRSSDFPIKTEAVIKLIIFSRVCKY